jgi:hypothetical protein
VNPQITIKKDYILVEPREYELYAILGCIADLFDMPENLEMNVIWVFKRGFSKITYDELYKIRDFVKENVPENENLDKRTAVVIESGFLSAMAHIFSRISENLSLNYKVFSDLPSAEKWLIDK